MKKGRAKIASKKTEVDGILFDSRSEAEYYRFLQHHPDIAEIELQPRFVLLEGFYITTREGKRRKRREWSYTADFRVTYKDGTQEVIDVKGHANERFPYFRKMFEWKYGQELVVIKKDRKLGWVRK